MILFCPDCKDSKVIDLTDEVENNEDFILFFKKYIYCPECDEYKFIGDKTKPGWTSPLVVQQPPPKSGAGAMARNG